MRSLRALVVMARVPIPGQAKTRLTPGLSPEQAAELARCFLLDVVAKGAGTPGCDLLLAYTPPDAREAIPAEAVAACSCLPQPAGDLGARMSGVFEAVFALGYASVVMIGSDLPTLPPATIRAAFDALESAPAAIAPSEDGGYHLIALSAPAPGLFEGVEWGTGRVYAQTEERLRELALPAFRLPLWYDVDTQIDLSRLAADLRAMLDAEDPALPLHTTRFLAEAGRLPPGGADYG